MCFPVHWFPLKFTSEEVNNAEKHYRKTLDSNLKKHRKEMSRRMKTLRKNDPKEYWKILNTGKSTKQPDIEINKWHKSEVQVLMKSWFISSGLILLSFSERSLKLLTFMLSMNFWAFNGFHLQQYEKTSEGNV
jgi:hypothetical protein